MKTLHNKKGFTLVEVLIVIAVVGILASVVLVGLGPIQRQGRDARRLSDLRQVQTGLELYYSRNGSYPNVNTWADLTTQLITGGAGGNVGVSNVPNDPRAGAGASYFYGTNAGSDYVIGATLEDDKNPALDNDIDGTVNGVACDGAVYCVQL